MSSAHRHRTACLLPSLTTVHYYFVLILRVTATLRNVVLTQKTATFIGIEYSSSLLQAGIHATTSYCLQTNRTDQRVYPDVATLFYPYL